jgi:hypothetical protein
MMPHEPRSLGYYAASHWMQGAMVLVVLGSLALGLLWALGDMKERAEKQVVDLTIRNMRTGMQLAMGEALIQQREREIASWVGGNPVGWLEAPPPGYRGECSAEESRGLSSGEWCFERVSRELVYRPDRVDHLRDSRGDEGRQCGQLRWRVARGSESAFSAGFVGLRIESASTCQLILD